MDFTSQILMWFFCAHLYGVGALCVMPKIAISLHEMSIPGMAH
jgi:hypothetical protein